MADGVSSGHASALKAVRQENTIIHLVLHLLVPAVAARVFFSRRFDQNWLKASGLMLLTMLIDADHLLASPVYEAQRCSMGFHPLHTFWPVVIYVALLAFKPTRIIGAGLVIHMLLDALDCVVMPSGMASLQQFFPWVAR